MRWLVGLHQSWLGICHSQRFIIHHHLLFWMGHLKEDVRARKSPDNCSCHSMTRLFITIYNYFLGTTRIRLTSAYSDHKCRLFSLHWNVRANCLTTLELEGMLVITTLAPHPSYFMRKRTVLLSGSGRRFRVPWWSTRKLITEISGAYTPSFETPIGDVLLAEMTPLQTAHVHPNVLLYRHFITRAYPRPSFINNLDTGLHDDCLGGKWPCSSCWLAEFLLESSFPFLYAYPDHIVSARALRLRKLWKTCARVQTGQGWWLTQTTDTLSRAPDMSVAIRILETNVLFMDMFISAIHDTLPKFVQARILEVTLRYFKHVVRRIVVDSTHGNEHNHCGH